MPAAPTEKERLMLRVALAPKGWSVTLRGLTIEF